MRRQNRPWGRGAAGKTPFVVAVMTDPEHPASVLYMRAKALKHVDMKELRAWFSSGFVQGSKVLTDGWEAHVSSGGWRSAKSPLFPWVNTVLGNLKGNIVGITRWISRGHLDRYLAEFSYRFNRRFDLKSILPRLLAAAVSTPAMPQRLLKMAWMAAVA